VERVVLGVDAGLARVRIGAGMSGRDEQAEREHENRNRRNASGGSWHHQDPRASYQ
jgi:hypothetical protein